MEKLKKLTGFQLKYIALVLMLLDHIHYFFDYTGKIPLWFSQLGRLSAPLFLFAIIEGFIHTHDRKKYFLKIYGLAIAMGAIQFGFSNVLHPLVRGDGFFPQNMMLSSFAILLVALQGIAWIEEKKYLRGIPTLLFPILLPFLFMPFYRIFMGSGNQLGMFVINLFNFTILPLHFSIMDGGTETLIVGIAMYLCRKTLKREVLAFVIVSLIVNLGRGFLVGAPLTLHTFLFLYFEWMEIFAAPLMLMYNGQRGKGSKHLFYIFYPLHIYLLYGLSVLLYG
ncbi:TraX family protein [Streptococcus tangpeifui]|uniref:TraX family protein n=1 Tax=Streptococcus tangpeifui TaxID=2709400 RepID=UPI0013ED3585|nr:TraX family protein [Streptococcus sp. ZJ373]